MSQIPTTAVLAPRQHGSSEHRTGWLSIGGLIATLRQYVCPECLAGKHGNCHGRGGFDENDEAVPCSCWTGNHQL